jgi:hypothetical protein
VHPDIILILQDQDEEQHQENERRSGGEPGGGCARGCVGDRNGGACTAGSLSGVTPPERSGDALTSPLPGGRFAGGVSAPACRGRLCVGSRSGNCEASDVMAAACDLWVGWDHLMAGNLTVQLRFEAQGPCQATSCRRTRLRQSATPCGHGLEGMPDVGRAERASSQGETDVNWPD